MYLYSFQTYERTSEGSNRNGQTDDRRRNAVSLFQTSRLWQQQHVRWNGTRQSLYTSSERYKLCKRQYSMCIWSTCILSWKIDAQITFSEYLTIYVQSLPSEVPFWANLKGAFLGQLHRGAFLANFKGVFLGQLQRCIVGPTAPKTEMMSDPEMCFSLTPNPTFIPEVSYLPQVKQ